MKERCHCVYNILYRNATSSNNIYTVVSWESFTPQFVIAIMTKVLIHPFVAQQKLEPQQRFFNSTKAQSIVVALGIQNSELNC